MHFPGHLLPPLIVWLLKRNDSPEIDAHGKEAVNFQISLVLYALVVIPVAGLITCGLGMLLYVPLYALGIVGMVMAALAANRGEFYRYPACIRFLR